ncbi:MAG: tyrosine-type recombinase/integrase [Flavobacteriaceae bacterium]|nr:tyrosine-type recombinase/integrase [Flavobacteriaceae bacterium]
MFYSRKLDLKYLYPKRKQKTLPKYLTRNEIIRLISVCQNIKHLCIIKLLYGCGLRVGEVLELRIKDVNSDQMLLHINMAKVRTGVIGSRFLFRLISFSFIPFKFILQTHFLLSTNHIRVKSFRSVHLLIPKENWMI